MIHKRKHQTPVLSNRSDKDSEVACALMTDLVLRYTERVPSRQLDLCVPTKMQYFRPLHAGFCLPHILFAAMDGKFEISSAPPRHCHRPSARNSLLRTTAAAAGLIAVALLALCNARGIERVWRHLPFSWARQFSLTAIDAANTANHGWQSHTAQHDTTWIDIEPSRMLQWHSCYSGEYDCAVSDISYPWSVFAYQGKHSRAYWDRGASHMCWPMKYYACPQSFLIV
jgi:hypothetical protein